MYIFYNTLEFTESLHMLFYLIFKLNAYEIV